MLERQYEKTGEKWIGRIIRKVLGCSRTYRCNSKYCPFCSNPRSVKAKRKIDDGSYQMPYKHPATVNKKSNNYRERAGQRQMGPFHGVPTAMTHCLTVNLALEPIEGDLKTALDRYRPRIHRVMNRMTSGATARGKFDIALKYADDLAFELPDRDLPEGITTGNLPHKRYAMLHIHFVVFDPWKTRLEIRDLFSKEFPGAKRVCAKRTKRHTALKDGSVVGGAQGYLEYASMEKVKVQFGDEAEDAFLEFTAIDNTWTRSNKNFAFGKAPSASGITIDHNRVAYLERENRRAWIRRNWSKLGYAERFLHVWMSGNFEMTSGIKSHSNYRENFKETLISTLRQYCNWLKGGFFEVLEFTKFLRWPESELAKIEPD